MKRRIVTTGAILAGLAALLAIVAALAVPSAGAWWVRHKLVPRMKAFFSRDVRVGTIRFGWDQVVLEEVEVAGPNDPAGHPLLTTQRITVTYDIWSAWDGEPDLGLVTFERPSVWLSDAAGDNWSDLARKWSRQRSRGASGRSRLRPRAIRLVGGDLRFERSGLTLSIDDVGGRIRARGPFRIELGGIEVRSDLGPSAGAERVVLEADLRDLRGSPRLEIQGGVASPWRGMSLTGIGGSVVPRSGDGTLDVALAGGYGGVDGTLWRAEGSVHPERRQADLHLWAERFTLEKIAPILAATPIVDPERASVDAALDLQVSPGMLGFRGTVHVSGLTVSDPWLAPRPVSDLSMSADVAGRYTARARVLELDSLDLATRGVRVSIQATAALRGGLDDDGSVRVLPRITAHLEVPAVPCQDALAAIPDELAGDVKGFQLAGSFSTSLDLAVDWAHLDDLVLDGSVGIFQCKALAASERMDAARFLSEFEHFVEVEPDQWIGITVGPSNPAYAPLWDISPYMVRVLLTTEDAGFFKHRGFIVREFRSALSKNLQAGYFRYGASSITMQLVKNILLFRQKTLARKLQELILTWYLEQMLSKERLLEMYMNVIEFGPGLYGIGAAAHHYFGKHPRDLNPVEAAFFGSILPNPKERHMQYCEGKLNRRGDAKVQRILKTMHERGHLNEEEYAAAVAAPLVFDRSEALSETECKALTKRLIQRQRPTLPPRFVAE